ncbi:small subunit processome component 20 homolog [Lineus longissimus]|uniref:small subunit processome component 20 homolog n=1 Tax=Lineus longissimus TaxID=88925 RepID=UPI002B4EF8F6
MKSKPTRHKEQNTFKFLTFAERLTGINIDVVRRIGKRAEVPEECGTFFTEGLQKWSELNCTEHFTNFSKEITNQVQSLPQLIHHEEQIITALRTHLQVPQSMALQPILDLVVQLARDLQVDFYPHFPGFFSIIVGLLGSYHHDVECLEAIFTCLSYLFKFLWRYMINDVENVYTQYAPLLRAEVRWYIRNFAAESFAFLMRKTRDWDVFFNFMLKRLESDPEEVPGVGRLFFEMMKGVKKQLHSCTEEVLTLLTSKLGEETERESLPYEHICEALKVTIESLAEHAGKEHIGLVWKILLKCLTDAFDKFDKASRKESSGIADHVHNILELVLVLVKYKDGALIVDTDQMAKCLMVMLEGKPLPEGYGRTLLEVISSVLMSPHTHLKSDVTPKLINLTFKSKYSRSLTMDFAQGLFSLSSFEKDVLPLLLNYCHSCMLLRDKSAKDDVLFLITELILNKSPIQRDAAQLNEYSTYLLDFSMAMKGKNEKKSFPNFVISILEDGITEDCDKSKLWGALVCAPHVRPMKDEVLTEAVLAIYQTLLKNLEDKKENESFLLCQSLVMLLCLKESEDFFEMVSLEDILTALRCWPADVHVLRAADAFFTHATNCDQPFMTEATLVEIFKIVDSNISSCYHQVRLLTLRILSQFDAKMPILEDQNMEQVCVFTICLEAEKVPLSVQNYREKLIYLRKLEHGSVQNNLPMEPLFAKVPLKYLLSNLYVNFTLLWDPVGKLIESHARVLSKEAFWSVYEDQLNMATDLAERAALECKPAPNRSGDPVTVENLGDRFVQCQEEVKNSKDRPDHMNYRQLLWKTMQNFPDKCEPRSRILSPLLFRFLNNEYYPADQTAAPHQDIRKTKDQIADDMAMDMTLTSGETTDEDLQEDEKADAEEENVTAKRSRRQIARSFLVLLKLFSKFKGPKSLHMEPKLRELYHEMLCHRDGEIQKVAFDCVMTYNNKSIVPYKEHFEKLLDDKHFKNEIVLFNIDSEASVVQRDHRVEVLPVLMRLLFGKMLGKAGRNTAGKDQSTKRKNIILAFLGGCQQSELHLFIDLMFAPFKQFVTGDIIERLTELTTDVDTSCVIPVGKLQGIIHTMDIIFKKLGNLIDSHLPNMLRITLCLTAMCHKLLEMRDQIKGRVINALKTLRMLCMNRVTQFFISFENYPFTTVEIDAVFLAAVWPQLSRLPDESISHPTPLLKLLYTWSGEARYLQLLGKFQKGNEELTPLPYIIALLSSKNVARSVVSMVLEIVERLITFEEPIEAEDDAVVPMEVTDCFGSQEDSSCPENSSLGVRLMFPHVPKVLEYLSGVVRALTGQRSKKHKIPAKDLNILSNISLYVTDQEQSATVVSLLLPYLVRDFMRSENVEVDILTTVANLIKKLDSPGRFIVTISKLFSTLSGRTSRNTLCHVMKAIAEKDPTYEKLATTVSNLSAWDKRRVDEPDYILRLDTYAEIKTAIKEMETIDVEYLIMVMHNCAFVLTTTDDMSLRDSSSYCMQEIIGRLSSIELDDKTYNATVVETLLPLIKSGIKSQSEVPRHEFIKVLAMAVRAFPQHSALNHLSKLTDTDIEVDFFENICHIQTHRRARGLKKFIKHLANHPIPANILLSYVMPMASVYITCPEYAKQHNLVDTAIEAIGCICKLLPWSKYLQLLKSYLYLLPKSIENQKTMVKLVVSILNAFHYDLSATQGAGDVLKPPVNDAVKKTKPVLEYVEEKPADDIVEDSDEEADVKEPGADDTQDDTSAETQTVVDGIVKCSRELATRIHQTVVKSIVPDLRNCLIEKAKSDDEHKAAKSKYAEDSEILRVPIALAMVKLLQRMPKGVLNVYLPSVLLKVCAFLRSRAKDIRDVARDTLIKIMSSLGNKYFNYILKELRAALRRGYQLHVLGYTVHALLKNMEPQLKAGDLDSSLENLTEIFNEELFGAVSAEKEVDGIVGKLMEAKSIKSFDSYEMVSRFVGKASITKIILPLKEILETNQNHKVTKKVETLLHRITLGLMENKDLPVETQMVFVHGLVNETMPLVTSSEKAKKEAPKPQDTRLQPQSTYLIPKAPPRGGVKATNTLKTNLHVLVEFGLQLLHYLLKRSSLVPSKIEHLQMLDPFITIMTECIKSKHVKIATLALRCLSWVFKFELPSLKENITKIASSLFVLLKNYAVAGGAKGENFDLVVVCFKAVTVLVRDVKYHVINTEQLQILLGYAEEDIHDYTRQATAFSLLQAILSRKLHIPEMVDVMTKISKLSITSDSPHVRRQCRQVLMQFLVNYPLGTKLKRHLEFFVMQLNYELESGRDSVLELLATIFTSFPVQIVDEYAGMFFVPLASRLINDESSECRKKAALVIKTLLAKVDNARRDELFTVTLSWCGDQKGVHRQLGLQLIGLFVEVESTKFDGRLQNAIPLVVDNMEPSKYTSCSDDVDVRNSDHLLFITLSTLIKIFKECGVVRDSKWTEHVNKIWDYTIELLLYPYTWVRLASAQLLGLMFGAWKPEELTSADETTTPKAKKKKVVSEYLKVDTRNKLRTIAAQCISQFQSQVDQDLAEQIIKNLVFLSKAIRVITSQEPPSDETELTTLHLQWLTKKMTREAKFEATTNPKVTLKRSSVFKWMAAVSVDLGSDHLPEFLPFMLPPLFRETTDSSSAADESLKVLGNEVIEMMKGIVGVETFTKNYAGVQQDVFTKREERKRQKAVNVVSNPEAAARKKMKKHLAKRDAKKRKIAEFRPAKKAKKLKLQNIAMLEES